jgi:membrane fusion protein (multidrug efflux system)
MYRDASVREATLPPSGTAQGPTRWRPRLKPVLLALLGLAALGGGGRFGWEWWTTGRFVETTDDTYVGGNVTAIAPHVGGFIAQVLVTDNQAVRAGQPLIRLDSRDYQAALDHARAVVDARSAALEGLRAGYGLQQATIRQAEAEVAASSAELAFATQDAARYQSLAVTNAGSRQNAQRSASVEQQRQASRAAAMAALDAGRQRLKVLTAQIAEADAGQAQAGADLEIAKLNLGYTEICAPIDGYVGNRAAQVGAYVAAGAYLMSVIPAEGLWVDANFKEDQLTRMADGDAATVVADLLPGHVFHGHVASIAPGTGAVFSVLPAENATGNFTKIVQRVPVRIVLDGQDVDLRRLRPGLSATARVDTRNAVPGTASARQAALDAASAQSAMR